MCRITSSNKTMHSKICFNAFSIKYLQNSDTSCFFLWWIFVMDSLCIKKDKKSFALGHLCAKQVWTRNILRLYTEDK